MQCLDTPYLERHNAYVYIMCTIYIYYVYYGAPRQGVPRHSIYKLRTDHKIAGLIKNLKYNTNRKNQSLIVEFSNTVKFFA